jgi:hypothetical protein
VYDQEFRLTSFHAGGEVFAETLRQPQAIRADGAGGSPGGLGPEERDFLAERDTFYMASLGSTGWPYVPHRGGPKGFLKVIDDRTIAFADFRGNKQYISTGNLMTNDRVAIILVDDPRQWRLKILGHVEIRGRESEGLAGEGPGPGVQGDH